MTAMTDKTLTQASYPKHAETFFARPPRHFIDGQFVDSKSTDLIPVYDPSTGQEISKLADATPAEIESAVTAARTSFDDGRWCNMPPLERTKILHRIADLLEEHSQELAELEAIDQGKPVGMAMHVDLPASIENFLHSAGSCSRLSGSTHDISNAPKDTFLSYTRREAVGVVAAIVPWNFPLIMATNKLAPALAAGCSIVLKPAEQTSMTALRLGELLQEAGLPDGVVNIVTGYGHTVGDSLVKHPMVDKVTFTGSTAIGKVINKTATDTMKNVTLELGGKSPVVVMPDVDPIEVANQAAGAIFFNSGQLCVAGSRLLVHQDIYSDVMTAVSEAASHWSPSASLCPNGNMGPLVSDKQYERVNSYIEAGIKEGATVLTGGDAPSSNGYYLNPTVLVDVTPDMTPVQEEIFGPVLVAQKFASVDEAISLANDTEFGLGASVWTKDVSNMHKLAAGIKSGTVWGNCHAIMDPTMPFGGYKQSGIGREYGEEGLDAYMETKSVIVKL